MHIQTHILSGWCVANHLNLTPRERALVMAAASFADLDGLGLFVSIDYYVAYHHVLAHNLLFGALLTGVLTLFSTHRLKAAALYFALFHLHLVMDYYGSGSGWGIHYLWPFTDTEILNPQAWELGSWQNMLAFLILLTWTLGIIIWKRRTPLEAILPKLDARIVRVFTRST